MALDGIVISNLVYELNHVLENARISKIAQPESDELLLTCKSNFHLSMEFKFTNFKVEFNLTNFKSRVSFSEFILTLDLFYLNILDYS